MEGKLGVKKSLQVVQVTKTWRGKGGNKPWGLCLAVLKCDNSTANCTQGSGPPLPHHSLLHIHFPQTEQVRAAKFLSDHHHTFGPLWYFLSLGFCSSQTKSGKEKNPIKACISCVAQQHDAAAGSHLQLAKSSSFFFVPIKLSSSLPQSSCPRYTTPPSACSGP